MTHPGLKPIASALLGMMLTTGLAAVSNSVIADTASSSAILDLHHTTTPIKHVVLLIGENRTLPLMCHTKAKRFRIYYLKALSLLMVKQALTQIWRHNPC